MGIPSSSPSEEPRRVPRPQFGERALAAATAELMATLDPKRYVGSKHHVVPKFILERFANTKHQVLVRDRSTGAARLCNVKDLAVTDFYTFVDVQGELDSSFEQLWGEIEGSAASILRDHLDNPFAKPRPFDMHERQSIDALVALQFVRGPALRRSIELVADYGTKLVNQHLLTPVELEEYEFLPHQNHHLEVLIQMVEKVEDQLATRGCLIVILDKPLFLTSDEPVCLERPEDFAPLTRRQLHDYPQAILIDGEPVPRSEVIQLQGRTRGVGLNTAQSIALPISPRHAVIYDATGTARPMPHVTLEGSNASHLAKEINTLCVDQAVNWIAGSPTHSTLRGLRLKQQPPQVAIIDGGSALSRAAGRHPRRHPRRLDKSPGPSRPQ